MSFDYLMGYIMSISMYMQNFITIFHSVQELGPFSLSQNLELGKASTDYKCHFAISWASLVNINVYAKVYQNIPLSSRDRAIFTFSEFEPRQRLGQSQMTFDNPLGYILSISMRMQNLSKYSKRFKSYRHFSRTGRDKIFTNGPRTKSSQTVRWQNQMFDYRALYEIQLQVSVDFLRVVQFENLKMYLI